jgi:4-diphosphocytidyl-2-C-methyl-D-erythritol kinase
LVIANAVTVQCPAKINEVLHVGEPDFRGFHPLNTIFQAVGLFDTIHFERSKENHFECDAPLPEFNTVTKAWSLLREIVNLPPMSVRLEKRIPSQSGLGGGSSDAAGFLRGALHMAACKIDDWSLRDAALSVGADVPFFLVGGRAEGRGYGEILTPLPDEETRWLLLAKPDVDCSTPVMYRLLDEAQRIKPAENDFERVAPAECIELIAQLRAFGSVRAGLSGSGSACFGFFPDEGSAAAAGGRLQVWNRVVKTLSRQDSVNL